MCTDKNSRSKQQRAEQSVLDARVKNIRVDGGLDNMAPLGQNRPTKIVLHGGTKNAGKKKIKS